MNMKIIEKGTKMYP